MEFNRPCLACGYHISHPYFHPDDHPLSVMELPRSAEESQDLPRLPMKFNICARCGHIFNVAFQSQDVSYEDRSNLMFNNGSGWQAYLGELVGRLHQEYDFNAKVCVEIGCGEGGFLEELRKYGAECVGFEPGIASEVASKKGLWVCKDYFDAEKDIPVFQPDILVCRHVLEHLENPLQFVSDIAYWSSRFGVYPLFLVEVPRIDKAVAQGRVNDFLYEHVSNFSDRSFAKMFELAGYEVLEASPQYGDEVLFGVVRPRPIPEYELHASIADRATSDLPAQLEDVRESLVDLKKTGQVALWGGTGKSSAFMNLFSLDARTFPIVVDSDPNKFGFFVPGTGQEIRDPKFLTEHPVDSIVITSQWRAKDIYEEINRRAIPHRACYAVVGRKLERYDGETL